MKIAIAGLAILKRIKGVDMRADVTCWATVVP